MSLGRINGRLLLVAAALAISLTSLVSASMETIVTTSISEQGITLDTVSRMKKKKQESFVSLSKGEENTLKVLAKKNSLAPVLKKELGQLKRRKTRGFFKKLFFRSFADVVARRRRFRMFRRQCRTQPSNYRPADGSCNNPRHVLRGAAGTPFRLLTWRGWSKQPLRNKRLPNPRVISNEIHHQAKPIENRRGMSEMVVFWGQYIDHCIAEFENDDKSPFDINIPKDDKFFKGGGKIKFFRSHKAATPNGWAAVNQLTSFIDGAATYGGHKSVADKVRSFEYGKLISGKSNLQDNLLPADEKSVFYSGDVRVNENPALTAIHTLFLREHNRICDEIYKVYPLWKDEEIYQMARKIVGGLQQAIVYHEFLPTILGRDIPYRGPRKGTWNINPQLSDEFAACGYRVGHSLINDKMTFIGKNGSVRKRPLQEVFFQPDLFNTYTLEDIFRGITRTKSAEVDVHITSQVRNFLFKTTQVGHMDLAAFNIQRGRDHRMPTYVQMRRRYGFMQPIWSFYQITKNKELAAKLKKVYKHVKYIDAWTGALAEPHCCGGSLGPLLRRMWMREFYRLRAGDRFYYEKWGDLKQGAREKIPTLKFLMDQKNKGKMMKWILEKNTDMSGAEIGNPWKA